MSYTMTNLYTSVPSPTGKVNRNAVASQRVAKEDRVQQALLVAIALTLIGGVALCLSAIPTVLVTWTTLAVVVGLSIAFQWRTRILAQWKPYTRPDVVEPSWRPTVRRGL